MDGAVEGEEAGVARVEDNIVFTPFNSIEERKEGHFDKNGTFIFKKEKGLVQDSWVQNIDNCQIADSSKFHKKPEEPDEPYDQVSTLRKMMSLMNKNETVIAAIRRIGVQINELRKTNRRVKSEEIKDQIKSLTGDLEELTSLADQSLFNLDKEIYEKTYSYLEKLIEQPAASTSGVSEMSVDDFESGRQGVKRKRELDDDPSDEEGDVHDMQILDNEESEDDSSEDELGI